MRCRLSLAAVAALGLTLSGAAAEPAAPHRLGLLVGVTHYPALTGCDLKGPANDVLLFQETLTRKFGFRPENVTILSEAEGAKEKDRYPTRGNIEREFQRLAKVAGPGSQVVILMAGHGSQQPEVAGGASQESDGLDEIFLPRDCGPWAGEGANASVQNAIVDDDMARWLRAIQDRGASVWLIMDSCHSGTMTRGVGETARQIPTDAPGGLKIPAETLARARQKARARPEETNRGVGSSAPLPPLPTGPGLVAFYACQPHETTVERELPMDAADPKPYGLLTYTIAQVLNQAQGPLSYDELMLQVQSRYTHMRRTAPTPMVEGPDRKREVLGTREMARSTITIAAVGDRFVLSAGKFHGLTEDAILAVYPPPGAANGERLVGYVKVVKLRVQQADVEPIAHDGKEAPPADALPGARCEIAAVDYGDAKLRVAIDAKDAGDALPRLREALANVSTAKLSLVTTVGTLDQADWVLRFRSGRVELVRAAEANGANAVPFDHALLDLRFPIWLKDRLAVIARAENLLRMASNPADQTLRGDTTAQIELSLTKLKDASDKKGEPITQSVPAFKPGDVVRYELSNPGRVPMDVTVLYIDSRYGIAPIFPLDGENNRLQPGDRVPIPPAAFGDETVGRENLIVIAVKSSGDRPGDFTFLAQPSIEQARAMSQGLKHPLLDLCEGAVLGVEGKRGAPRRAQVDTYQLRVVPVDVRRASP